jgi:hypothetical protein
MKRAVFFLFPFICSFSLDSFCQEKKLNQELLAWYKQTLPFYQDVISGSQYADAAAGYRGSPFFGSAAIGNGQIWINRLGYDQIPLLYDVWLDEVVTIHPRYNQKTIIKAEKIEKFILSDSSVFVRFPPNSGYSKHSHGFYQVISDGYPMLLRKSYRTLDAVNETGLITRKFTETQDYFFWYQGEFRKISNKADAATYLGLSPKEVKKHFSNEPLVFKKNPEAYLLELLEILKGKEGNFKGFSTR